jgi:hypothetical protein
MTNPIIEYAGLKAAVADTLDRKDLESQIPGLIYQAHVKFNRELRVRDMMTKATVTNTGDAIALPDDFASPYSLVDSKGCKLEFVTEDDADSYRVGRHYGQRYTIFGSNIELIPAPSDGTSFTLRYFAKIPFMSADTDTNWLLTKSPDLYVAGACLEASVYLEHDERLETWAGLRQQIVIAMNLESEQALKPQGALRAKLRSFG